MKSRGLTVRFTYEEQLQKQLVRLEVVRKKKKKQSLFDSLSSLRRVEAEHTVEAACSTEKS